MLQCQQIDCDQRKQCFELDVEYSTVCNRIWYCTTDHSPTKRIPIKLHLREQGFF